MDDSNVPSLLGMGYMGDVPMNDLSIRTPAVLFWSEDNPCFFRGKAGEGIGVVLTSDMICHGLC